MIEPGKDSVIRHLEKLILSLARAAPGLLLAVGKVLGRAGTGVYNGLLGRTSVSSDSKEIAKKNNEKEHWFVRGTVGVTRGTGAVIRTSVNVIRSCYRLIQRLRGRETGKTRSEGLAGKEGPAVSKANPVKNENLKKHALQKSVSHDDKQRLSKRIATAKRLSEQQNKQKRERSPQDLRRTNSSPSLI